MFHCFFSFLFFFFRKPHLAFQEFTYEIQEVSDLYQPPVTKKKKKKKIKTKLNKTFKKYPI